MSKVFFKNLEFEVPEGVYEPREDSYLAAEYLWEQKLENKKVLDMGTGSGFLALICKEKGAEVTAADINPKSLETTRKNANKHNQEIETVKTDLFKKIGEKYDIIIFNSPYLPGETDKQPMEYKAWEGGEGGREVLDRFIGKAGDYLREKGYLLIVQSSITGLEETLEKLEKNSLEGELVKTQKVPWEQLQLIKAYKF